MPSAYLAPASPHRPATRETRDDAVARIGAVLAETAALPALLARTAHPVRFVATAPGDECGACPQTGRDARPHPADAAAIVCHQGPDTGYVYREPACVEHLANTVGYELRLPDVAVWVEVPAQLVVELPAAWLAGCFCDPTRGQSCERCDGTLAEQIGLI